jgi:glycosyltransferase involved in cell wall biosynthesis
MRILQVVTRSETGGGQSVVANLAAELYARGHEVAIASGPEGGGEAWLGLDKGIELFDIKGLVRDISPLNELRAVGSLGGLYRSYRPDIVHLHTSKAGFLGRLAPGFPKDKIVYTMHGYFQLRDINRKFLLVDKALRKLCGAVVAVSRNDERLMDEDGYRSVYVANGIPDLRGRARPPAGMALRLKEIRERGLPVVMVIARDANFKRLDLAREAARRLEGRALLVWIGGEPEADDPPSFLALGECPQASACLEFADIYLQPSNHEGLSMALLEALCAGLPCVASSVGGNLETLGLDPNGTPDDGSAGPFESDRGFLVPNDAGVMAEVLGRLAADAALRTRMGLAARAAWRERYSSAAMAEGYLSLYKTLAGGRG